MKCDEFEVWRNGGGGDPLYFGRWFSYFLRGNVNNMKEGEDVSALPMLDQLWLFESLMVLADLDNSPIEFELVDVSKSTDTEKGEIVIRESWYSVRFPWGMERDFFYVDGDDKSIKPFARGTMATKDGLLDLALCIDVWLSDERRKPCFTLHRDAVPDADEPASEHKTIRSKDIFEKFNIPRSSFYGLVRKSKIKIVKKGVYDLDKIEKLMQKNGYFCP